MTPDERVTAQIEAARRRREAAKRTRARLDQARAHGLEARHAAKLRHLDQVEATRPADPTPDDDPPAAA